MSEPTLSPLKTWSHLAEQRRRPSEYEIVSTNLHWHTRGDQAFDIDDKGFMNEWYREYRNESPITHENITANIPISALINPLLKIRSLIGSPLRNIV